MVEGELRVLAISNLPPHVMGGAENQVFRLVEAWRSAGVQVAVAGHRIPDGEQRVGRANIRTLHIGTWSFAGRATRALGYLLSLAWMSWRNRRKFDVVYCRGLGDGALVLSLLKSIGICRWPIMATPINAGGRGDIWFLRSVPGWRLWCAILDRQVNVINLINERIGSELDCLGIRRPKRTAIPNGIVLGTTMARDSVSSVRRLIWTGRMEHQKGLDLLLTALARCKGRGYQFRLRLLGGGEQREQLLALRDQLGLHCEVFFEDALPEDEVRGRLADADVFVLPSRYEGMSNSGLEAMEASLPIICTRCGGLDSHVLSGAGWVCSPDAIEDLERVLSTMFEETDETLLSMGRRSREIIEDRFDISRVASENIAVMRSLAESSRHH